MSEWQLALLLVTGLVAGWLNVMAGGGSLLSVPVMLFLGLPGPVANGSNRIAILAQNIAAVATYRRRGGYRWRLGLSLALAALPGAVAGAAVGVQLGGVWFDRVLAGVMILVMLLMLGDRKPSSRVVTASGNQPVSRQRMVAGHLLMLLAGFWGGFIQVGIGFILMPILHRALRLNLVETNMHKVFIVLVYTVAALAVFASQLSLAWAAGAALALGNAAGGWLGARTTLAHGARWIRPVFLLALAAMVVKLLWPW